MNTLVIGGTSGIGLSIRNKLISRGDTVYTLSRSKTNFKNHIQYDIETNGLNNILDFKISNLIFTHRYRGKSWLKEYKITVHSVGKIITLLKDKFIVGASIVVIGSNASRFAVDGQDWSYHSTRGALESITRFYASELGEFGIRCNLIMPNTIIKEENKRFFDKTNKKRILLEKITPLKRMGTSEDIANVVSFLCSESSSFITGQTIHVDGGLSILSQENISNIINNK